jgi:predicted nucleotidyltransferase
MANLSEKPGANKRIQGMAEIINELSVINKMPFEELVAAITGTIIGSAGEGAIKKIYLFGSRAYGRHKADSDIDLCVVFSDSMDDDEVYVKIARALFDKKILYIDLLAYYETVFNERIKKKGIENTIYTKGRLLYSGQ